jgi:hypothetical protein
MNGKDPCLGCFGKIRFHKSLGPSRCWPGTPLQNMDAVLSGVDRDRNKHLFAVRHSGGAFETPGLYTFLDVFH